MRLDEVHHLKMKAYSVDLREKIVAAVGHGMSKAQVARTFGVCATSVKRYVKLAEEGKPLSPGKASGRKGKLSGSGMKLLEEDLRVRSALIYEKRTALLCTYSPDFKPVEEAFSKIKGIVRKAQARTREAVVEALGFAISAVSAQDVRGFFEHCGYTTLVQSL